MPYSPNNKYKAECHPERANYARKMCKSCYDKWVRETQPEKVKIWRRAGRLRTRYGITVERFDDDMSNCGGMCEICRARPVKHVDHNHATGKYRGLLCTTCNVGLGAFQDSPDLLAAAITYLSRDRDG